MYDLTLDMEAIHAFQTKYPTWWFTIGWCDLTRDFTCGAQKHSPEMPLIEKLYNDGFDCQDFSCDSDGSISDAIYDVMKQIEEALTQN